SRPPSCSRTPRSACSFTSSGRPAPGDPGAPGEIATSGSASTDRVAWPCSPPTRSWRTTAGTSSTIRERRRGSGRGAKRPPGTAGVPAGLLTRLFDLKPALLPTSFPGKETRRLGCDPDVLDHSPRLRVANQDAQDFI